MRARIAGFSSGAAALLLPFIASAQTGTIEGVLIYASKLLNGAIGLFITLAIVLFFWGLIKYLLSMSPDDASNGIKIMFWGVVAIFVMVSIWGIIRLVQRSFGVVEVEPILPKGIYYRP
jgi:hypothetical protein